MQRVVKCALFYKFCIALKYASSVKTSSREWSCPSALMSEDNRPLTACLLCSHTGPRVFRTLRNSVHMCTEHFVTSHVYWTLRESVHMCTEHFAAVFTCVLNTSQECSHVYWTLRNSVYVCTEHFVSVHMCTEHFTTVFTCVLNTSKQCSHVYWTLRECSHVYWTLRNCVHMCTEHFAKVCAFCALYVSPLFGTTCMKFLVLQNCEGPLESSDLCSVWLKWTAGSNSLHV
jgi:hypothetical protein